MFEGRLGDGNDAFGHLGGFLAFLCGWRGGREGGREGGRVAGVRQTAWRMDRSRREKSTLHIIYIFPVSLAFSPVTAAAAAAAAAAPYRCCCPSHISFNSSSPLFPSPNVPATSANSLLR